MHKTLLITPPTGEPIDLAEAKLHLKVTSTLEDALITNWITTARRLIERYLNRALLTQEYEMYLDEWPCESFRIPYPPLGAVSEISYKNGDGDDTVLDADAYYWVSVADEPAKVTKKYNAVWPILQLGRPDAIKVTFTCGYGAAEDVPQEIKDAMKLWITDLYENRGSIAVGQAVTVNKIPTYIIDLIHSYKIYAF